MDGQAACRIAGAVAASPAPCWLNAPKGAAVASVACVAVPQAEVGAYDRNGFHMTHSLLTGSEVRELQAETDRLVIQVSS